MKEINDKILGDSEKTLEELIKKNKAFFEQFKGEEFSAKLKRDIKSQKCFGNKDKHYKKTLAEKWADPRLKQLQTVWLRDKRVLDIGCNSGIVDLLIAVRHQPKLIIGIDIDHRMVRGAIDNMQKVINDQEQMELLVAQIKKERTKEDTEMVESHESESKRMQVEREHRLSDILKRVEKLPISLQLSIQGELNLLTKDPSAFLKGLQDEGA